MNIPQKTSEADLLQLPEIDGLVREIKRQETVTTVPEEVKEPVFSDIWALFLDCSQQYDYRTRKGDRKAAFLFSNSFLLPLRLRVTMRER